MPTEPAPAARRRPTSDGALLAAAVRAGREALALTVDGVRAVADRLDSAGPAIDILLGATGRVIVTGLGKSGLVGAKLAATLASTGTPAFFVHAAEALHGDAGMLVDGDVLLAISNSGNTAEVVHFAELAAERGNQVIAMTGCGGGSCLHQLADAVIDVSVEREADPYDLVPSSSTTVTIVLGDALAIALMVARNFGPDDFGRHHPGGSLGARLAPGAASAGAGSA
jgi:arabinose-5-phosphate isomerase